MRPRPIAIRAFVSFVPLVLLLSCRGPQQGYTSIAAGAAPLKERFNADAGRTRIVILPAPN